MRLQSSRPWSKIPNIADALVAPPRPNVQKIFVQEAHPHQAHPPEAKLSQKVPYLAGNGLLHDHHPPRACLKIHPVQKQNQTQKVCRKVSNRSEWPTDAPNSESQLCPSRKEVAAKAPCFQVNFAISQVLGAFVWRRPGFLYVSQSKFVWRNTAAPKISKVLYGAADHPKVSSGGAPLKISHS